MAFELLVLPPAWVKAKDVDGTKFKTLTKIINKSYAKVATKFGIITSERVMHHESFLDCLLIVDGKEAFFFLLLGPTEEFEKLEKTGYVRDFNSSNDTYEGSMNCDIPEEFVSKFQLSKESEVKITVVEPDFVVDEAIGKRVIATLGLKDFYDKDESVKAYELTAVTSYVRRLGGAFINYVIDNFLAKKVPGTFNYDKKFILHCDAIKEHGLNKFYTDSCGFKPSPEPDLLLTLNSDGSIAGDAIEKSLVATRSFHLCFFYREIPQAA